MWKQLAPAVAADREQPEFGRVADAARPGLAHDGVHRAGARGQQAIDVLAGVEAGGERGVLGGERGPRGAGPGRVLLVARRGVRAGRAHRSLSSPGSRVRISTPPAVTATVCSHCAESFRSLVTTVQPSGSRRVCRLPSLIIGSMVKVIPSL